LAVRAPLRDVRTSATSSGVRTNAEQIVVILTVIALADCACRRTRSTSWAPEIGIAAPGVAGESARKTVVAMKVARVVWIDLTIRGASVVAFGTTKIRRAGGASEIGYTRQTINRA
jgi:hypothetical protein